MFKGPQNRSNMLDWYQTENTRSLVAGPYDFANVLLDVSIVFSLYFRFWVGGCFISAQLFNKNQYGRRKKSIYKILPNFSSEHINIMFL